jgi:hypothetical protein
VTPEREPPGRDRPSAWGEPAPAYESEPEPPAEVTGESATFTRPPLSSNGSHAGGDGQVSAQAWPVGLRPATVTKGREHRFLRGVRSVVVLTVIALALGVATAASLGVIIWLIATAIHHAASN